MKRYFVAVSCFCALGSLVSAQSLSDVAKKEKERRDKVGAGTSHNYSEKDLQHGGLRTSLPAKPAPAGGGTTGGSAEDQSKDKKAEPAQEDPTKTQAYWHDRVSGIDKRIQELETRLQSPEMTSNYRGGMDRQRVERDLAQARADRQAIEDEARRKGVPPGWVR